MIMSHKQKMSRIKSCKTAGSRVQDATAWICGIAAVLLFFCASPLLAQALKLSSPIDCDLSSDCYIQQFVDHDPGPQAIDFQCSTLTYEGHKGTDFALRDRGELGRNINVLASAAGVVKGVRDGMPDTGFSNETAAAIAGKECGNGLVLDHGNGWETQYCHMKQGTVAVTEGQKVATGEVLGQVGQSGQAEFPHVHLSVRKDGQIIDPFDPDGTLSCATPGDSTLWTTPLLYRPGGILTVGFTDHVPDYEAIKNGTAAQSALPSDAPALVVFGFLFGTKKGDTLNLKVTGPNGTIVENAIQFEKAQAQSFRAVGKQRKGASWPAGDYEGTATLTRKGVQISRQSNTITLP